MRALAFKENKNIQMKRSKEIQSYKGKINQDTIIIINIFL